MSQNPFEQNQNPFGQQQQQNPFGQQQQNPFGQQGGFGQSSFGPSGFNQPMEPQRRRGGGGRCLLIGLVVVIACCLVCVGGAAIAALSAKPAVLAGIWVNQAFTGSADQTKELHCDENGQSAAYSIAFMLRYPNLSSNNNPFTNISMEMEGNNATVKTQFEHNGVTIDYEAVFVTNQDQDGFKIAGINFGCIEEIREISPLPSGPSESPLE
jgi:hypothetical protein